MIRALHADTEHTSTGCWLWRRRRDPGGYGKVTVAKRTLSTHRLMAEAAHGPLPPGSVVHHACAVRLCIAPHHLQVVSHHENAAEMLGRKHYEQRIAALECALRALDPEHAALTCE